MSATITPGSQTYTLSSSGVTVTNAATHGNLTSGIGITIQGSNDVVINTGVLLGGTDAALYVTAGVGNTLVNEAGALVQGGGIAAGVVFASVPGAVVNYGTILSNGPKTNAVEFFGGGGFVLNTGTIGYGGIFASPGNGPLTVTNLGVILGGGNTGFGGIDATAGATIQNTGTVTSGGANYAINVTGGAGTIVNAGTIDGGAAPAIIMARGFANRVIQDVGAAIIGGVNGGDAARAVLELAPGKDVGTLSATGGQFSNFSRLQFDAEASWIVEADATLPGEFATIAGFTAFDGIQFSGAEAVVSSSSNGTITSVTLAGDADIVLNFSGTFPAGFATTPVAGTSLLQPICFLPGTMIGTPAGERKIENLRIGDLVTTLHNGDRRIKWIGTGRVLSTPGRRSAATPVIVRRHALAHKVPNEDLHVTKAHSLYLDGVFIPVEFLVNHRTILWDDQAREITVFHIELDSHDIILANGAPVETFRDDGNRWMFQNAGRDWNTQPEKPCAPVLTRGLVVDAIWRQLLNRAGPRTLPPLTADPDMHLIVDGKRVDSAERAGESVRFRLLGRPEHVHIASRTGSPCELGLARDPRELGVAVRRITIRNQAASVTIPADDSRLTTGFHDFEPQLDQRWTNGYAPIPAELFACFDAGPLDVEVTVGGTTQYLDLGIPAENAA